MTLERKPFLCHLDVAPQAIVWRPIYLFAKSVDKGEDDLDLFEFVSFIAGNELSFDLRHYADHPRHTTTIYLSLEIKNTERISQITKQIMKELELPMHALAWQRGWDFKFGDLPRPPADRLREPEARALVLKILADTRDGWAKTSTIKNSIPRYIDLSPVDLQRSQSRPKEQKWQQIVGNVVSHSSSSLSIFSLQHVEMVDGGLLLTDGGRTYLQNIGYLS